jgi:hypothetical protein
MHAMDKNRDKQLIEALGGPAKVAELLGLPKYGGVQRVQNWTNRGIPYEMKVRHPALFMPELATAPAAHAPAATENIANVAPLLLNIDSSDQERREADQRHDLNRRDGERRELGRRTNSIATS